MPGSSQMDLNHFSQSTQGSDSQQHQRQLQQLQQQQQQQQVLPQITIVQLTTFNDLGRAMAGLSTVRNHLAPELLFEMLVVCPWQVGERRAECLEFLALHNSLTPHLGAPCRGTAPAAPPRYNRSKAEEVLRVEGLLPPVPASAVAAPPACACSDPSVGGSGGCCRCPPVWVLPEHIALGLSLNEMADIPIYGYRLQMALKLTVAFYISTPHYLVLDSDVLMVRPVPPVAVRWLFPEPGRAIYQPQRRGSHGAWWTSTERLLGLGGPQPNNSSCVPQDPTAHVFGVTPAMLATPLAEMTVRYWEQRFGGSGGSRFATMQSMLPKRSPFWTEYCSYFIVAECVGGVGTTQLHHAKRKKAPKVLAAGGQVQEDAPALYRGLWRRGAGNWSGPGGRVVACADCVFLVVQSNTGVSERRVVGDLEALFV
ncbi:hypothetical protein TSOC_005553 [Tetrabaena socialis]|uniref:Uncharacterized protein n=1 Tax=Tetrabaena socialis TaxID=47790 RepID=A0A2J8A603_9CHLO|nr:hypothetical protein TSOC_005553 [Tetrabaena socialis]|eukprot:PNH07930.1 hypothetical protein TSOC_005553 [Tetrabaena socialis]